MLLRLRPFHVWMIAILAIGGALIVHLALRFETVKLGYEVGALKREHQRLVEAKRLLSIEAATLRDTHRVESIARKSLLMMSPKPQNVIKVDHSKRRSLAGRIR